MGMDKSALFYHHGDRPWGVRHDERYRISGIATYPCIGHLRSVTGKKN